jgi:hypothetical protein
MSHEHEHEHEHDQQPAPDALDQPLSVDPFLLPAERQGWRGLGAPGNRKRKWWTLIHNDQVLVTALLLIPGEQSVRHSHETGELSIHYDGTNHPVVLWHPPGEVHPSLPTPADYDDPLVDAARAARQSAEDSGMADLLGRLILEHQDMRRRLDDLARRQMGPNIIVDVLFPPFKTTIEDPVVGRGPTVVGQWYD